MFYRFAPTLVEVRQPPAGSPVRWDAIYRAGATVNWLRRYTEPRAANVHGTQEVLCLVHRHRTVPVHQLSTTGVFAGARDRACR